MTKHPDTGSGIWLFSIVGYGNINAVSFVKMQESELQNSVVDISLCVIVSYPLKAKIVVNRKKSSVNRVPSLLLTIS